MYSGVVGGNGYVSSRPSSSGLYEILDLILDKGIVIDAYVRVSLVGIELLTVDARIVVASVDTYLRWAEAADRLVLNSDPSTLSDLVSGGGMGMAGQAGRAAVGKGKEATKKKSRRFLSKITGGEEDEEEEEEEEDNSQRHQSRSGSKRK